MPGFLSALFAAQEDHGSVTTVTDHQEIDQSTALDPSVHMHFAEGGTAQHPDGLVTDWSAIENIDAHLDINTLTHVGPDDGHTSGSI